jgi:hypothetical protein
VIEFDCVLDYNYPGVTVRPEAWEDPEIFPILFMEPFVSSGDERYSNTSGEGDGGVVIFHRAHQIDYNNLEKRVSAMIDLLYNCKPEQVSKNKERAVDLCKKCLRSQEAYLTAILRIALYNSRDREIPQKTIVIEPGLKKEAVRNTLKIALESFSYGELKNMLEEVQGEELK